SRLDGRGALPLPRQSRGGAAVRRSSDSISRKHRICRQRPARSRVDNQFRCSSPCARASPWRRDSGRRPPRCRARRWWSPCRRCRGRDRRWRRGRSASPCPECGTAHPSNRSTDRDSLRSRPANAMNAPTSTSCLAGAADRAPRESNRLPASASNPPTKNRRPPSHRHTMTYANADRLDASIVGNAARQFRAATGSKVTRHAHLRALLLLRFLRLVSLLVLPRLQPPVGDEAGDEADGEHDERAIDDLMWLRLTCVEIRAVNLRQDAVRQLGEVESDHDDLDPLNLSLDRSDDVQVIGHALLQVFGLCGEFELRFGRVLGFKVCERLAYVREYARHIEAHLTETIVAMYDLAPANLCEVTVDGEAQQLSAQAGQKVGRVFVRHHGDAGLLDDSQQCASLQQRGQVRDEVFQEQARHARGVEGMIKRALIRDQ